MSIVYVLLESDKPITASNTGTPRAVVTDAKKAWAWCNYDSEYRDLHELELDTFPADAKLLPESKIPSDKPQTIDPDVARRVQETRNLVDELNQRIKNSPEIQDILNKVRKKRSSKQKENTPHE